MVSDSQGVAVLAVAELGDRHVEFLAYLSRRRIGKGVHRSWVVNKAVVGPSGVHVPLERLDLVGLHERVVGTV
jgi:hypothetical protein